MPWDLLNGGAISYYSSRSTSPITILTEDGSIPARTLGLVVSRSISGGMHEDLEVTNNNMKPVRFRWKSCCAPTSPISSRSSQEHPTRGRITTEWSASKQRLTTTYRNADFARSLTVDADSATKAVYANGRISFEVSLAPGEAWHCCLLYSLTDGDRQFAARPPYRAK